MMQQYPQQTPSLPSSQAQQLAQRPSQPTYKDDRLDALDQQRAKDLEDMNRAGAQISQRLRDLEHSNPRAQSDQEAKDREVGRLQEQLAAVNRQRLEESERNSQQLAELVRSQAVSPATQTPAFDMSALQKVIRETQARQLSAADIERVIEEQVSRRLSGMATKADIQSAGAQMQSALSQVPAGLNEQQVQQAVNRELNNVMQGVADRVNRQRYLAGQSPQDTPSQQVQTQTEFVIEELPDDDDVVVHQTAGHEQTSRGGATATQLQGTGSAVTSTGRGLPQTSGANEVQQWVSQRSADSQQNPQRQQLAAGNDVFSQAQASAANNIRVINQKAIQGAPSTPGAMTISNLQRAEPAVTQYIPNRAATVSTQAITSGQQGLSVQSHGAGSQYRALEAPLPQQPAHQGSLTIMGKSDQQVQTATSRPQQAALEAPSTPFTVPGNAQALVNRPVATSLTHLPQNQNAPLSSNAPWQSQTAVNQRQLEAAPAPLQQLELTRSGSAVPQYQGPAQMAAHPRQIEAAASARQLEAAPASTQQLQMTRAQPAVPHNHGAGQGATQGRQIVAGIPLRQLEAPPTHSSDFATAGQELVHQSRDVARNTPRR